MPVMLQVGSDVNVVGRGVVRHVGRKVGVGDAVQLLASGANIGEVNQRVMSANIVGPTTSSEAGVGQVFLVTFPGQSIK